MTLFQGLVLFFLVFIIGQLVGLAILIDRVRR